MKDEFLANTSHELRTPLTALRSVGEVGLRGATTTEEAREVIGSMLEEVDRLGRLADESGTWSNTEDLLVGDVVTRTLHLDSAPPGLGRPAGEREPAPTPEQELSREVLSTGDLR